MPSLLFNLGGTLMLLNNWENHQKLLTKDLCQMDLILQTALKIGLKIGLSFTGDGGFHGVLLLVSFNMFCICVYVYFLIVSYSTYKLKLMFSNFDNSLSLGNTKIINISLHY